MRKVTCHGIKDEEGRSHQRPNHSETQRRETAQAQVIRSLVRNESPLSWLRLKQPKQQEWTKRAQWLQGDPIATDHACQKLTSDQNFRLVGCRSKKFIIAN